MPFDCHFGEERDFDHREGDFMLGVVVGLLLAIPFWGAVIWFVMLLIS